MGNQRAFVSLYRLLISGLLVASAASSPHFVKRVEPDCTDSAVASSGSAGIHAPSLPESSKAYQS